jgi:hypothetical protein
VRHIQWSPQLAPGTAVSTVFYDELVRADIGIMPNALPIRDRLTALETTMFPEAEFGYEPFDHLVRLKASSNPGRLFPFARLGIPVVSDFSPSAGQFIRDGESGFIVSSAYGWFEALEALCASAELRTRMAAHLRTIVDAEYERQLVAFLAFCSKPLKSGTLALGSGPAAEDELARIGRYARPKGRGRVRSLGHRIKHLMGLSA